jgi:5,10-methylene-tetrahydrofolate dehydrogenase/methenyl tetrahydrofolate cyclohydrolase
VHALAFLIHPALKHRPDLRGAHASVIGSSKTVGTLMALLL